MDYNNYTDSQKIIINDLFEARNTLSTFIADENNIRAIERAADIIIMSLKSGGKIIACGNGGSMSDAMHFCSELTGRYRNNRKPIAAIAINDPSYLTCTSNDMGYDYSFSRYIAALAKPIDVVMLITTSGNSENIIQALKAAQWISKCNVILLTGKDGGRLMTEVGSEIKTLTPDCTILVSHQGYADRIQEIHIKIIHILVRLIEKGLGYV